MKNINRLITKFANFFTKITQKNYITTADKWPIS